MFTLNVRTDVKPLQDKLNRLQKGLGDRAVNSALNKTVAQAKTQMIRAITSEYVIKASLVRERLLVERARRKGIQFTATLIGNPAGRAKRAMNLIHFVEKSVSLAEAKRRRKQGTLNGTFVTIKRGSGRKLIQGAFIGNKGRTVFKRVGKGRLPIEPAQTIGVPQMFNAKKINIPIQQFMASIFPGIYKHEAEYFLSTVK